MIHQRIAVLALAASLAACGGGGGGGGDDGGGTVPSACSVSAQKVFVRDTTNEWYLFPDLLPAQVDAGQFATAQELLDFMTATARSQGKDRYFSYVTTRQADASFLQEGQFIGFGFRMQIAGTQVRFLDVFESSPASGAGIERGERLLAIDSGAGYVAVENLLPTDPNLSNALGPSEEGVVRGIRFTLDGAVVDASLTKRVVTIQPIPDDGFAILSLPTNPSIPVGYVNLRSYISTAETPLRSAFTQLAAAGVQNVILDLRYNGGGLISIADLLGDLLGALRQPDDVFGRLRFRSSKSANDISYFFNPQPGQSVDAVNLAVITTGASASASELTVNSMKSWANVAIVGSDTFGKPVGQSAFDLSGCDTRLRLVTFRSVNRDEEGDYYNGLAETLPGAACAAADDLTRATSDPQEQSTASALRWLETGSCDTGMSALATSRKLSVEAKAVRYPVPDQPSPAQVHLPGLY